MNNKYILPISIILGCFILGIFYYVVQVDQQRSAEKQQIIENQMKEYELKIKVEAEQQAELNNLKEKYREECLTVNEGNSEQLQKFYDDCEDKICGENIEKVASQYSGVDFVNSCIESKLNGTFVKSGLIKKAEKWTGETFLNGEKMSDPNDFPEFISKQDCLDWGHNEKIKNQTDSFKCGKNCGFFNSPNGDNYFLCDEEVDI